MPLYRLDLDSVTKKFGIKRSSSVKPVQWEFPQACEDCDTKHMVAQRIRQIPTVIDVEVSDWMTLEPKAQEKFINLG